MRFFYIEYEKMHYQLNKEEIFDFVREEPEFTDYTMDQLNQDLDALVRWKNLTPLQDPGRVYTIADYKNTQYSYTMSEYAVEIERMTVRLENLFFESDNLSTNYFIRLKNSGNDHPDQFNRGGTTGNRRIPWKEFLRYGNPHYFDRGTPPGNLLVYALCWRENCGIRLAAASGPPPAASGSAMIAGDKSLPN